MYQNYKQNTRRTLKTQDIHYNKANQEWSRVSEHMDINEFEQARISKLSSKQVLICQYIALYVQKHITRGPFCHNFSLDLRQAARGARICETNLLGPCLIPHWQS